MSKTFRDELVQRFVKLLEVRGRSSEIARIIGRSPSFVNNVKQGNPVNALHLKAVGELLGSEEVLRLLDLELPKEHHCSKEVPGTSYRVAALQAMLSEIEKNHPAVFDRIEAYIHGTAEATAVTDKVRAK